MEAGRCPPPTQARAQVTSSVQFPHIPADKVWAMNCLGGQTMAKCHLGNAGAWEQLL